MRLFSAIILLFLIFYSTFSVILLIMLAQNSTELNSSKNISGKISGFKKIYKGLLHKRSKLYFLTAVVLVRINGSGYTDKGIWTKDDLKDWIQYMQYAGVEHIYIYDNYLYKRDSLEMWSVNMFKKSVVSYHDWSKQSKTAGISAHDHALHYTRNVSTWQIAFDMNEYPFSLKDSDDGFLSRIIRNQAYYHPDVTQILMKDYVFLGKRGNIYGYIFEKILIRLRKEKTMLEMKSIYRSDCVRNVHEHHSIMKCGDSVDLDPSILRSNIYHLKSDTAKYRDFIGDTKYDESVLTLVGKLRKWRKN